jgi:hypothetical protein
MVTSAELSLNGLVIFTLDFLLISSAFVKVSFVFNLGTKGYLLFGSMHCPVALVIQAKTD